LNYTMIFFSEELEIQWVLKMDRLTSIHSCRKFARICVEMDLEKLSLGI
jgi:hypothetical protein